MKNKFFYLLSTLMLIGVAQVFFTGCGSSDNNSTNCSSGYVYSSTYGGCLSQGSCASGMGLYNGSCVYISATSTGTCTTAGYTWNGTSCVYGSSSCGTGYYFNGSSCIVSNGTTGVCTAGYVWNGSTCVYSGTSGTGGGLVAYCPYGYQYSSYTGMCMLVM